MKLATLLMITATVLAGMSTANAQQAERDMSMMSGGLLLPRMDALAGRKLFASKGCVVCHSVNGVGGEDAAALDAEFMELPMNPFDFVARMWLGAPAMIEAQRNELGEQIVFTGEELANIIAFVHDSEEQRLFSKDDVPKQIAEIMEHMGAEGDAHSK